MLTHLCVAAQSSDLHAAPPSHVYIKYEEIRKGAFCLTCTGNFRITRNSYFDFDEFLRNIKQGGDFPTLKWEDGIGLLCYNKAVQGEYIYCLSL